MKTHAMIPGGRVLAGLAAAAALFAACSSSTDPGGGGGGDVEVAYSPLTASLDMMVDESREFRATVTGADQATIAWTVGGIGVAGGAVYLHTPAAVGVDSIAVAVSAGSWTGGRSWRVTVGPDLAKLPATVTGVVVSHGPAPAQVKVVWLSVPATYYPVADYLVACSFSGPVDAANWEQATLLGVFPHDPGTLFREKIFGEADGMVPGAAAWFAVRARDDHGQLSPIDSIHALTISYAWTLDLLVTDDAGVPLQSIILNYGGQESAYTDAAGRASIGPLRSIDAVTVATTSPHYDYVSPPVAVREDELRIVLLRKYALDHDPCGLNDYPDFLAYARAVTLTTGVGDRTTVLNKWDHYPLSVWIPEAVSANLRWDLQALAADAVTIWNDVLGPGYLVSAADSLSADIVVKFCDVGAPNIGRVVVLLPGDTLGERIPVKVELEIEDVLDLIPDAQPIWVTEVTLHELGHALGHYGHTCGSAKGNLMDAGGAIGALADGPANAVNPDELRLIRAYRQLPQGTDMARYGSR